MDKTVQNTINSLVDAFDSYEIPDEYRDTVEAFKQKLVDFGNLHPDTIYFFQEYPDSGLQEEYNDLISKVVTASYKPIDSEVKLPSVSEYLEQYRQAYEELCKRDSQKGRAAYETLFNVANRTDDLLEAQLIIEKERLNWKIITEDAIEIFEKKLSKMDPLNLATTAKLLGQIDVYKCAKSEAELDYLIDKQDVKDVSIIADYTIKMTLAAGLSYELLKYIDTHDKKYKKHICATLKYMTDYMGLKFDDLINNDGVAIWMLDPHNLDEYGKTKDAMNPKVLETFKSIIDTIQEEEKE